MATDAKRVLTGAPDQLTTGAIWSGPPMLPFTDPTDPFVATLPQNFKDGGYVGEDGITLALNRSTADIKDWNGDIVRKIIEEFSGTLTYQHLEFSEFALGETFGTANISQLKAATTSAGKQSKIKLNADELPRRARWFRMKDGNARVVILAPNSQVTEIGDISFVKTDAIRLENTVSCYPDNHGNSLYIYLDDGVYTGSGA
ncbi:MAG: hypothetical protein Q4G35_03250 [Propionibacteriaceae bacterium]|nr:hypothetical protein [Propionibacteriaceae bacterium]